MYIIYRDYIQITLKQGWKVKCCVLTQHRCGHSATLSLLWRHNGHNSVSNHQPYDCLLRRLFRRRSKQTSKLHVTGLCAGNSPGPVNFPHKWPVTRKMFPFDDVIMMKGHSDQLISWIRNLMYLNWRSLYIMLTWANGIYQITSVESWVVEIRSVIQWDTARVYRLIQRLLQWMLYYHH